MVYFVDNPASLPDLRQFTPAGQRHRLLKNYAEENPQITQWQNIGFSEEGRPIDALILGDGPCRISILSGSHSDEPVGTETILQLVRLLVENHKIHPDFLHKFSFYLIPHINPDGEYRNKNWIEKWPDVNAYFTSAFREIPGRDVEFGYPELRIENKTVAKFLKSHSTFSLHCSLHGMGFSEGLMLLIERSWLNRTQQLQQEFASLAKQQNLPLHDHNRMGEKGFTYIGPGFTTTSESKAMQHFFEKKGDSETAAKFKLNSMEYVCTLGGDPLCLVTELPLFMLHVRLPEHRSGYPVAYLKFLERKPEIIRKLSKGVSIEKELVEFDIRPLPLQTAVYIQLNTIAYALELLN